MELVSMVKYRYSFIHQASLLHWAVDINASEVVRLLLERQPDLQFWCRESSV